MQGEYLSIDTAQKIARLEKQNDYLTNLLNKFELEVNRQWKIINLAYDIVENNFVSTIVVDRLKEVLRQGIDVNKENENA